MVDDPKTIREVNLNVDSINQRVDLLKTMLIAVFGLLAAILGSATYIMFQVSNVRVDLAVVQSTVAELKEQHKGIQETLKSLANQSIATLSRIENKLNAPTPPQQLSGPLQLSSSDIDFLRSALKLAPTGKTLELKVGAAVPDKEKVPLVPESITAKIPSLRGYRYFIDASGAAIFVSDRTSTIDAIVDPT